MLWNSCLKFCQPRKDYFKVISWMGKVMTHKHPKISELSNIFSWRMEIYFNYTQWYIINNFPSLHKFFPACTKNSLADNKCFVALSDSTFYYTIFKKFWHLREVPGNINLVGCVKPNTQKCGSCSCWSFSPKMRQWGYQS